MDKNQVLTTQELADYMKLNEKTILKMAQKGELPGVKIGNQWRFHMSAIDQYLQKDILNTPADEIDNILGSTNQLIPLSRLFDTELMDLDLKEEDKDAVLSRLAEIADKAGIVPDRAELLAELKDREDMLSTAVGNGIAIPHPRKPSTKIFKKPNIIFARSKKGLDFNAPDNKNVHLFFMICAPNMVIHLRLMAKISKLLHIEGMIDRLMEINSEKDKITMLLEMERKHLFPWEAM